MANFCAKCGASLVPGARFCAECGAAAGEPTGREDTGAGSGAAPAGGAGGIDVGGLTQNMASLLCYPLLFISGIAFLVLEPYRRDPMVRFHAWQVILFSVALIVIAIGFGILRFIFGFIYLDRLISLVSWLVRVGLIGAWILMAVKAYGGEKWKLPIIGDLAEQQAAKG